MNILFIGGGNMTRSMVSGLIANGFNTASITVVDRHAEKREFFSTTYHVNCAEAAHHFIEHADVVFIAIKPQGAKGTLEVFKPHFKTQLVISVMAGISIAHLQNWLGEKLPIVRGMPNSPSAIQAGATGLFANECVTAEHKKQTEKLLTSIGIIAWLDDEKHIDAVIALSGSAPAYYFYIMEIIADVAVKMGLPKEMARDFAIQAGFGATKLARENSDSLETLRAQVTSKNGTTEAAINVMKEKDLAGLLEAAMRAAVKRSKELSGN